MYRTKLCLMIRPTLSGNRVAEIWNILEVNMYGLIVCCVIKNVLLPHFMEYVYFAVLFLALFPLSGRCK